MPPRPRSCFAIAPPGLEPLVAKELATLGLADLRVETGGVAFGADDAGLGRANLSLRTASRVLVRLAEFPARAFYELERKAKRIAWGDVMAPGAPVAFRVTSRKSKLYHQGAIAERLIAASGGVVADAGEAEPSDEESPGSAGGAQLFVVRVMRDVVTLSADSSGEHLHRRGYREATAKAPLRENLAAALLLAAGYDGTEALLDPFCGAGTIPIEAALIARRIAPGLGRRFAFQSWPGFDQAAWAAVHREARDAVLPRAPASIAGRDRDAGAVAAARANAGRAGVGADVSFEQGPLSLAEAPAGHGLIATNPPWGVRIGERNAADAAHAELGRFVRERCPGWRVALVSGDRRLAAATGLALNVALETTHGGLSVTLLRTSR